ncbi:MAG TPA: tetratricopeptide repeat protein, partial [Planctomycetaceae bacterium]
MAGGTTGDASRAGGRAVRAERRIEAARGYLALDMPDHALRELAAVGEPHRHRFDLARLRGDALRQQRRFGDAAAAYTRALAERPDSLPALMGVASCYRQLGQLGRAVAAMEEANRLHPNEPAVLFTLSRLYALNGEVPRSLGWLGRAVRLCPEIAACAEREADF